MEVRLIESEICRFRELVLPVSYHTVPLAATRYQRSSIDFLRERRRAFGLDRALDGKGRRFLLSRADASRRRIRNEDALVEGLAKLGFERLVCKEHGDEEVIAILSSAEVVVGMHGANLTNIVHCRPGTLVIELVTPSFCGHLRYYWDLAEICAMDYGVVFVPEEGAAMSSEELRLRDACVDVDCVCERIEERMRRAGDEDRDS